MDTNMFKMLKLSDFTFPEHFQEKDLTYSDLHGRGDVMGCFIVLFRAEDKPDETAALSFESMLEDDFVKGIGNDILRSIGFKVKLGDSAEAIRKAYGEPYAVNQRSDDTAHYYYLSDNGKTYLRFGVSKTNGLYALELTQDERIIEKRKEAIGKVAV